MTPEAWTFFGVLTTTSGGTLVELVRTRKKVDRTATAEQLTQVGDRATTAASEAAEAARPMGNGFTTKVLGALADLKTGQDDLSRRLNQHIDDHASSDLRGRHSRDTGGAG